MKKTVLLTFASIFSLIGCNSHKHDLRHFSGANPTGFNNGYKEYYQCNTCHKFYEDKEGKKEVSGTDLIIPALKTVTLDETSLIPGEDETFITKEGDKISNNNYGLLVKTDGYYARLPHNSYICLFDLKGINTIKITAKGKADIKTSNKIIDKNTNYTSVYQYDFGSEDSSLQFSVDPLISNNFYIYSKSDEGLYIKSIEIDINNEIANNLKEEDILSKSSLDSAATSYVYSYQQKNITNNSDSALRIDITEDSIPSSPITIKLDKTYTINPTNQLKFDVKTDSTNKKTCKVELINNVGFEEVYVDITSSWNSIITSINKEYSFNSIKLVPTVSEKCSLIFDNMNIVSI